MTVRLSVALMHAWRHHRRWLIVHIATWLFSAVLVTTMIAVTISIETAAPTIHPTTWCRYFSYHDMANYSRICGRMNSWLPGHYSSAGTDTGLTPDRIKALSEGIRRN